MLKLPQYCNFLVTFVVQKKKVSATILRENFKKSSLIEFCSTMRPDNDPLKIILFFQIWQLGLMDLFHHKQKFM